jgi:hypothetical protein
VWPRRDWFKKADESRLGEHTGYRGLLLAAAANSAPAKKRFIDQAAPCQASAACRNFRALAYSLPARFFSKKNQRSFRVLHASPLPSAALAPHAPRLLASREKKNLKNPHHRRASKRFGAHPRIFGTKDNNIRFEATHNVGASN